MVVAERKQHFDRFLRIAPLGFFGFLRQFFRLVIVYVLSTTNKWSRRRFGAQRQRTPIETTRLWPVKCVLRRCLPWPRRAFATPSRPKRDFDHLIFQVIRSAIGGALRLPSFSRPREGFSRCARIRVRVTRSEIFSIRFRRTCRSKVNLSRGTLKDNQSLRLLSGKLARPTPATYVKPIFQPFEGERYV